MVIAVIAVIRARVGIRDGGLTQEKSEEGKIMLLCCYAVKSHLGTEKSCCYAVKSHLGTGLGPKEKTQYRHYWQYCDREFFPRILGRGTGVELRWDRGGAGVGPGWTQHLVFWSAKIGIRCC